MLCSCPRSECLCFSRLVYSVQDVSDCQRSSQRCLVPQCIPTHSFLGLLSCQRLAMDLHIRVELVVHVNMSGADFCSSA